LTTISLITQDIPHRKTRTGTNKYGKIIKFLPYVGWRQIVKRTPIKIRETFSDENINSTIFFNEFEYFSLLYILGIIRKFTIIKVISIINSCK
jgi:hypothetical protein